MRPNLLDFIISPRVTEKATSLSEQNKVVFQVRKDVEKKMIKKYPDQYFWWYRALRSSGSRCDQCHGNDQSRGPSCNPPGRDQCPAGIRIARAITLGLHCGQ